MVQRFSRRLPGGLTGAALRFVGLVVGASSAVLVVTIPLGLASGATLNRSISLGFYVLGALLGLLGLLAGNRGPFRRSDEHKPLAFRRQLRTATSDERLETINVSVLMVVLGLLLLAIGVAIDDRYPLL